MVQKRVSILLPVEAHQPVHVGGTAAGVADNENRLFYIDLPVVVKQDLIQQPKERIDDTENCEQYHEKDGEQGSLYREMLKTLQVNQFGQGLDMEIKYTGM